MKWFRKRDGHPVAPRVDRLLRSAADHIDACVAGIPQNFARGNLEYAARNSNSGIRCRMERAALLARGKRDSARAREELASAMSFVATLEEAVTRSEQRGFSEEPSNFIHLMNFRGALLLLMLLNDWPRLDRVVGLAKLPVVKEEGLEEESGGVLDTIMRMLVATITDNKSAFAAAQKRFERARSIDRYYSVYFEYDRLMASILARDDAALNEFLAALDDQFLRRGGDKKLVDQEPLKAAGEDNDLVFDVWAVALALFAQHLGMTVSHSSSIVPVREFSAQAP